MPIYEDELDQEKVEDTRRRNVCAVCGDWLNRFLCPDTGRAFIACNDWLRTHHEGIERPPSRYELEGEGAFNIPTRREIMEERLGKAKAGTLAKYTGVVSLTKVQATRILESIWPKAPPEEIFKAAMICMTYSLNPLMGHVYLIPFKTKDGPSWAIIIGIKATRLITSRCQHYSYLDGTPRVMTETEQKAILGEVDPDNIQAITKLKAKDGSEAQGYGSWLKSEEPYGTEKGNSKARMAFIRSERDALNRLFPGEMPQGVEIADEDFLPIEGEDGEWKEKKAGKPAAAKTPPKHNGSLTQPQKNKILADAEKMGYEPEEVTTIIQKRFKVESIDDLSVTQASEVINMIARGEGLPPSEAGEGEK